jgi:glycosyltransferase involved in cell wall biosynthesis
MKVSVIIATYNAGSYLKEAIESILVQTFRDFECIVVDDGSSDGSDAIRHQISDERLRWVTLPTNCGISMARNVGMKCAMGQYIAVMDSDDVCLPERLQEQVEFLDNNPTFHIVGARTIRVSQDIKNVIDQPNHPLEDDIIKARLILLNGSALIHPTMMIRGDFCRENNIYYPVRKMDVDHAFWIKCIRAGAKFACLPSRLLYKRRHSENITFLEKDRKEPLKTPLRVELLQLFYPHMTSAECEALAGLMQKNSTISQTQLSLGLSAGFKAMSIIKPEWGESRAHLNRIIAQYLNKALATTIKTS